MDERARIVAWLRGIPANKQIEFPCSCAEESHDIAIIAAADCIERGDHMQDTNNG